MDIIVHILERGKLRHREVSYFGQALMTDTDRAYIQTKVHPGFFYCSYPHIPRVREEIILW